MTFVDALKTGLPMRRATWREAVLGGVTDAVNRAMALRTFWVFATVINEETAGTSIFIRLSDGRRHTMMLMDYLADDWETMAVPGRVVTNLGSYD